MLSVNQNIRIALPCLPYCSSLASFAELSFSFHSPLVSTEYHSFHWHRHRHRHRLSFASLSYICMSKTAKCETVSGSIAHIFAYVNIWVSFIAFLDQSDASAYQTVWSISVTWRTLENCFACTTIRSIELNWIESHSIYKYQYILIEWNLWTSYFSLWILQFLLFWFIFSFLARLVYSWKFHKSQNSIQFNWIPYSRFLLLRTSGWFKIVLNNRLASKSTYFHENISNSSGLFLFRAKVFLCKNTNQNYPNEQRKKKKRNDKIVLMIYELYALLLFIVLKKQKKEVNSFPLVWSKWNWKISLS